MEDILQATFSLDMSARVKTHKVARKLYKRVRPLAASIGKLLMSWRHLASNHTMTTLQTSIVGFDYTDTTLSPYTSQAPLAVLTAIFKTTSV